MDRRKIERISKALGDKTRLLIFEEISAREQMNCGEIVSLRGVTPATVSHHLRVLAEAQLIDCRRQGQRVYSTANRATVDQYAKALGKIARKSVKDLARRRS